MRRFPFTAGQVFSSMLGSFFNHFLLFFRVVFLIVFGSFWGTKMEPFWRPKSIKMRLMSFLFLFISCWFFHYFCILGGVLCWFYIGSVFASFFASIFGRFGGRFGGHFGRLWGVQIDPFWHRFFDYFCISFQERPKSAQEGPKSSQERPKSA